jgi:hypothetical protein
VIKELRIKSADKIENILFTVMLWSSHNMLYCAKKFPLDKSILYESLYKVHA